MRMRMRMRKFAKDVAHTMRMMRSQSRKHGLAVINLDVGGGSTIIVLDFLKTTKFICI
jgi:chemotaxis protein histidine kinase CheA